MSQPILDGTNKYSENLKFPSYQEYQLNRLLPTIKITMLTGSLFILLFSIIDINNFPQLTNQILIIRFLTIVPLVLIFICSFFNSVRTALPYLILIFGIISLWFYIYLHTILDGKIYFLSLAFIYYSLVIVSLSSLYSRKSIILSYIIAAVTINAIVLFYAHEYSEYLIQLMIKSIGTHLFAIIIALKTRASQIESYNFALLIHKRSMLDSLTKVYNRHGFDVWIHENLDSGDEKTSAISIIMLDIDDFKKVNDQYGHQSGDLVIKTTAETIKSLVEETDCIVRFGGEEFVILLKDISSKRCFKLAEKIRKYIECKTYKSETNIDFNITVSVGISTQNSEQTTLHELIGTADKNLYTAKSNGKNRVIGY